MSDEGGALEDEPTDVQVDLGLNDPALAPAFRFSDRGQRVLATTIYRRLSKFFSKGVVFAFRRGNAPTGTKRASVVFECDEMLELAELCTRAMRRAPTLSDKSRRAWARDRIDEAVAGNALPCDPETDAILTAAAHATTPIAGPRLKAYVTLVANGAPRRFDPDELNRVIAKFFEQHIARQMPGTAKKTEAHAYAVALADEICKRVLHGAGLMPGLQCTELDRGKHRQRDDVRRRRIGEPPSRRPRRSSNQLRRARRRPAHSSTAR